MADVEHENIYVHNPKTGHTVGLRVAKDREVTVERGGKTEKVKVTDPRRDIVAQRTKRGQLEAGKSSDVKKATAKSSSSS